MLQPFLQLKLTGKDCQLKAFLGSKAVGVNPNCANQEIAVKLAAYLGSEDAQLAHFQLRGQSPVNTDLATNSEVAADPVASAMAEVATNCSVAQPIIDMQGYWDAATPFGDSFVNGAEDQITHDNAAEKTEAFNTQLAVHLNNLLYSYQFKFSPKVPEFPEPWNMLVYWVGM